MTGYAHVNRVTEQTGSAAIRPLYRSYACSTVGRQLTRAWINEARRPKQESK